MQLNLCPVQPSPPKTRQNSGLLSVLRGWRGLPGILKREDSGTMRKRKNSADSGSNQSKASPALLSSLDVMLVDVFSVLPVFHTSGVAQDSVTGTKFFFKDFLWERKKKKMEKQASRLSFKLFKS